MNFVFPEVVRWIFLGDVGEATELLDASARKKGFKYRSSTSGFLVEIPRSLRKRRPAATISGVYCRSELGTEVLWHCGPDASRNYEYILELEEEFPKNRIHYHGIIEASAAAGLELYGSRHFRAVVSHLQDDERVLAMARGKLGVELCLVLLTSSRLLLLGACLEAPPLENVPLDSIKSMTLGKKSSGETLRVAIAPRTILISNLGHSEGHGIATTYRACKRELSRTGPLFPSEHSSDEAAP